MNDRAHDPDPFQGLVDALRSDARPVELADEARVIETMRAALSPTEATNVSKFSSRTSRIAIAVAASVLGVSGLAAAGGGTVLPSFGKAPFEQAPPDSRPPVDVPANVRSTSTSTTSTTLADDDETITADASTLLDDPETTLVDDPETAFDETKCAEGNHGKTVSSVAQSVEPGPGHGEAVSAAAQSSCGKQADGDDDEVDADDETSTTTEKAKGRSGERGQGKGQEKSGEKSNRPADDHTDDVDD